MTTTTESSFGAKLRRAQDILTYISSFPGYNPPRAQESVAGFTTFLNSIVTTNATESANRQNYKAAVDQRQNAFLKTPNSIDKMLVPIRGAVEAQYGKKSTEATAIAAIIKTMRTTKLVRPPADPNNPTQETTTSQSERSYGSMTQHFNDIINTLTQFTGYNPTNNAIKIAGLQTTATQLTTLNNNVAAKIQTLKNTRANRLALYDDLKDRVQRIKAYVKAQYGNNSNEYNIIKGISI